MSTGLFDIFKIGVGPSSSHTMGPMRAACRFARELRDHGVLGSVDRVQVELYGSLALTGKGHATDRAVLLGLSGYEPATIDPDSIETTVASIRAAKQVSLAGERLIGFEEARDLIFHRSTMFPPGAETQHPNGMRFLAFDSDGAVIDKRTFFSLGGGFIAEDGVGRNLQNRGTLDGDQDPERIPYPFHSAAELLDMAQHHSLSIDELMMANECARLSAADPDVGMDALHDRVRSGIAKIWETMQGCVERGIAAEGILPGGLEVRRRAHRLADRLRQREAEGQGQGLHGDLLAPLDWVTVYAMAVNEENAAGGRVVTAPTNGAAGVVPAVAHYYDRFVPGSNWEGILRFFLVSAAIGILYKENASISGAEVGCQ